MRAAALDELETVLLAACEQEEEWPAQIASGVCAGVDFAIARPDSARVLIAEPIGSGGRSSSYDRLIGRLAGFLRVKVPADSRPHATTDEAVVAGIVGLVGDHVRMGRSARLERLRRELVLLTLVPYVGFAEAQRRAAQAPARESS